MSEAFFSLSCGFKFFFSVSQSHREIGRPGEAGGVGGGDTFSIQPAAISPVLVYLAVRVLCGRETPSRAMPCFSLFFSSSVVGACSSRGCVQRVLACRTAVRAAVMAA